MAGWSLITAIAFGLGFIEDVIGLLPSPAEIKRAEEEMKGGAKRLLDAYFLNLAKSLEKQIGVGKVPIDFEQETQNLLTNIPIGADLGFYEQAYASMTHIERQMRLLE